MKSRLISSSRYIFMNKPSEPRMLFTGKNAVRITVSNDNDFNEAPFVKDVLLPHEYHEDISSTCFSGISFDKSKRQVKISFDDKTLEIRADPARLFLDIKTCQDEGFYGFGEWFNAFRRTSGELTIHNLESPAFLQHKQTYSAFPCFLSDRGYMIFILNAHKAKVRINKPDGKLTVKFSGGKLDFFLISGADFKEIITGYTELTGRPPLLPLWAFGLWNTAYPVENQEETLTRIREHREKQIPLDTVIFDYHWQEAFSNFRWRRSIFPDPEKMLGLMKEAGIKTGLIYTPYINGDSYPLYKIAVRFYVKNAPDGVPFLSKDYATDNYNEGLKNGYFAHDSVTWWLGRGGAVDFTNEKACNWWFDKQKPLLELGVYFFKNDGAEYLPKGSRSTIGLDDEEFHNIYCFYYTKALFERCQKYHGDKRALVFSRTNWAGTQRYPGIFLGDQTPEFKHIAATMKCGLNMSLLGYAYWGADVLSLYKSPSAELHRRYSQFSIFSPLSRYFSCPHDPNRNPWGIDRGCEENFRRHINLKMRLLPYYYRLARQAYDTGIPIIRPLYLEFPDDPHTRPIWEQLMIGDALMIAPVLEPVAKSIKTYFPKGLWYSWWDTKSFEGPGWFDVPVDDWHLPLFIRGGRPVILGKVLQFIPDDHRFADLEIHAFPPFDGQAVLYEDDGSSLAYQRGESLMQKFTFSPEAGKGLSVVAHPPAGAFPGQPLKRKITFVLHGCDSFSGKATADGCTVDDVNYDEDYMTLKVHAQIDTASGAVIHIARA
jgi:alpha-glucosidase (family GH31 glycosyl hydrolase)